MQDGRERSEEAGAWLRENLKDKPEPKVSLSIEGEEVSPADYRRVLEILFRPRTDGAAL